MPCRCSWAPALVLLLAAASLAVAPQGGTPSGKKKTVARTGHIPDTEADALRDIHRRLPAGAAAADDSLSVVERFKKQMAADDFAKDVCSLKGISCADGHVSVVSLRKQKLGGTVPVELQMFPSLKALDLSHNSLTGTIPRWLTSLRLLEKLNLAENGLTVRLSTGFLLIFCWFSVGFRLTLGSILTHRAGSLSISASSPG